MSTFLLKGYFIVLIDDMDITMMTQMSTYSISHALLKYIRYLLFYLPEVYKLNEPLLALLWSIILLNAMIFLSCSSDSFL